VAPSLTQAHLGANRRTWRAGHHLWITRMALDRRDLLEREHYLFTQLETAFAKDGLGIAVPHIVPARRGLAVVTTDAWCYRATAHLEGGRPDGNSARTFVAAARTLRALHDSLGAMPDECAVLSPLIPGLPVLIRRVHDPRWSPATADPDERPLLAEAADRLSACLPELSRLPTHLIHGDWSLPNWVGPPIIDLAQLLSGVIMFSPLPPDQVIPEVLDGYGFDDDLELLAAALLAYWFNNYWLLRDESALDVTALEGVGALAVQPKRLKQALAFAPIPP
jgi:hypothetical protein